MELVFGRSVFSEILGVLAELFFCSHISCFNYLLIPYESRMASLDLTLRFAEGNMKVMKGKLVM